VAKFTSRGPINARNFRYVFHHNVPHDIHKDYSAEERDHDGNNDDSETELPEVLDSGIQNTKKLVRWVKDHSKFQTIGMYVD
jgi:hypothetical protein